jgi:plastocyanin
VAADARADWSYVIPAGTGARLDSGERVELLPARIDARVGQVIRIVNRDSRGYLLGPFYVGAHETLSQRFTSPGVFEGDCSVHPSGQIVLEVRA